MRRIINSTFITLDGVVENPHLWPSLGSAGAAESFDIQTELLQSCDAVVMGRATYESFAAAWPGRSDSFADRLNAIQKYVASWVHPLILGRSGPRAPHFLECPSTQLRLVDSRSLPNGIAILRYQVERAA
jgi:hypothetical protein